MQSMNIFMEMYSSPGGAFFLGICLTLGAMASAVAVGYYTMLRQRSLLYFSFTILTLYLLVGLSHPNPRALFETGTSLDYIRIQQGIAGVCMFFYYKLVRSSFRPLPISPRLFDLSGYTAFLSKIPVVLFPNYGLIMVSTFSMVFFLMLAAAGSFRYDAKSRAMYLLKIGCAIPGTINIVYPLARMGVVPSAYLSTFVAPLLLGTLAFFSGVWFFGLVELARDAHARAKQESLLKMERTLFQLRDMLKGPIETIETSVINLDEGAHIHPLIHKVDNSVSRLKLIRAVLSRFEKNVASGNAGRVVSGRLP